MVPCSFDHQIIAILEKFVSVDLWKYYSSDVRRSLPELVNSCLGNSELITPAGLNIFNVFHISVVK